MLGFRRCSRLAHVTGLRRRLWCGLVPPLDLMVRRHPRVTDLLAATPSAPRRPMGSVAAPLGNGRRAVTLGHDRDSWWSCRFVVPGRSAETSLGGNCHPYGVPGPPVRWSVRSITPTPAVPVVDASATGGGVGLAIAVVVAVIALAGVIYSSALQRRTGRETVREARKAAEAALASAAASDKAAEASAAAVREARTADAKLQVWRQREETMRMVRWGLEQAASTNPKAAAIGQNTLNALQKGSLVQPADTAFVATVTEFVAAWSMTLLTPRSRML